MSRVRSIVSPGGPKWKPDKRLKPLTVDEKKISIRMFDLANPPSPGEFYRWKTYSDAMGAWFDSLELVKMFHDGRTISKLSPGPENDEESIIHGEKEFLDCVDSLVYSDHHDPCGTFASEGQGDTCIESIIFKLKSGELAIARFHFDVIVQGPCGGSDGIDGDFTTKNIDNTSSIINTHLSKDDDLVEFLWKYILEYSNHC